MIAAAGTIIGKARSAIHICICRTIFLRIKISGEFLGVLSFEHKLPKLLSAVLLHHAICASQAIAIPSPFELNLKHRATYIELNYRSIDGAQERTHAPS